MRSIMKKEDKLIRFESLAFGLFLHFGLYSILGKGEWALDFLNLDKNEYRKLTSSFNPDKSTFDKILPLAKKAGMKYAVLTTRHHDGFSLYDTKGLSNFDITTTPYKDDLVKDFVDSCHKYGLTPYLYHTLIDWEVGKKVNGTYDAYLDYLYKSIDLLCSNYGEIGGFWFDGDWGFKKGEISFDSIYGLIKRKQPNATITLNAGLSALGQLNNKRADIVTFERGSTFKIDDNLPFSGEKCQITGETWGYASLDINYKSNKEILNDLLLSRKTNTNFLLNLSPTGNGDLKIQDQSILESLILWNQIYQGCIYGKPLDLIKTSDDSCFVLKNNEDMYLICLNMPMAGDPNVAKEKAIIKDIELLTKLDIKEIVWMDNNEPLKIEKFNGRYNVSLTPFPYGVNLISRVAKIKTQLD